MKHSSRPQPKASLHLPLVAVLVLTIFASSSGSAQIPATGGPDAQVPNALKQNPELLNEFGRLMQRIQNEVKLPGSRSQSRLLPYLPQSTVFYAALPNYGEASHQVLNIFQQELQESAALSAWWNSADVAEHRADIQDAFEKFYQVSQYLGDEIVVAATDDNPKEPNLVILAEVRKPGLGPFLQAMLKSSTLKVGSKIKLVSPEELATAGDLDSTHPTLVLVRPDVIVIGFRAAPLRTLNAGLDNHGGQFASTDFGQRVVRAYQEGTTVVAALDVHQVLAHFTGAVGTNSSVLGQTGFSDAKYLVWKQRNLAVGNSSQLELSFNGPRHGVASWLATPGRMGSLEFISPNPVMVTSMLLKDPAEIWDEIRAMATNSQPKAFASFDQMQAGMHLDLKEDLLRYLGGEVALSMDQPSPDAAGWEVVLSVKDPAKVQSALDKLLGNMRIGSQAFERGGVTYHAVPIPAPKKAMEVDYAFVGGYLVIGSSREKLAEALHVYGAGGSLAKSEKFRASLPSPEASAIFYEDTQAMASLMLSRSMPGLSASLAQSPKAADNKPLVVCGYGDESALREESRTPGVDVGMVLIGGRYCHSQPGPRANFGERSCGGIQPSHHQCSSTLVFDRILAARVCSEFGRPGPGPARTGFPFFGACRDRG